MPPAPPVRCNDKGCVVSNAYGAWGDDRTECAVHRVVYPTSEDELLAAVADASRNRLMVKVTSRFSHTIPKLVTLSLEPAFKRSITYSFQDDATFQDQFMDHAQKHEFADITWFPSQHQVAFRIDDRVPLNTSGDGINDFVGFQLIHCHRRLHSQKVFDETRSVKGKCVTAAAELAYKKLIGNGLKNKIIFTGYPIVGRQGKMQTSGSCQHSSAVDILSTCAWDPRNKGLFFYESTAFFSAAKFKDFIADVKKLQDLNPDNYNGLMIRFVKKSESFLGQPEDSVVVDFNYYRARDPAMPRLNQDVWEEVEQMAFFKHGGRPHWAKNRKVAFLGVQEKYPDFGDFVAAMKELDPQGMFQSPWSDEVINGGEPMKDDGCALEGQCICSEDRHSVRVKATCANLVLFMRKQGFVDTVMLSWVLIQVILDCNFVLLDQYACVFNWPKISLSQQEVILQDYW
ncbi:L-gulonolactone oxidase 3 [Canna indica]|uniref:L-gulonolactone oxidase n=1 Tax=Canna indica TaxID=4628 RepID=A0AAQ3L529_9LILI|nr:L-gulonolactone oxidase 3 [Canna indica]